MDDVDNSKSGINRNPSLVNVATVWLILAVVILIIIGSFFGYSYFTETMELKNKELTLWFIFMLFAATISCIFGAITSHISQKSEEKREKSMMQKITSVFVEKADEIKDEVNVAMKRSDLVSGERKNILRLLMNHSSLIGEISRIMILAYDSGAFSKFFTDHFKDALFKSKEFKCNTLEILIHDQKIGPDHEIIKKWLNFYNTKTIETLRIRRAADKRRSFFGMVIEFDMYHPIGLIGFYKPQDENNENTVTVLNNPYGVFSEEGASVLSVLDEYFRHYWDNAFKLKDESIHTG